jgi:hypothetical protein
MRGLTKLEDESLVLCLKWDRPCQGGHEGPPEESPWDEATLETLRARGLIEFYTCPDGCSHVSITPLGRKAKEIADIVGRGNP